MKVSFFEEFPTEKSLAKLKLITFPTRVFLATKSYEEFLVIAKKFAQKNVTFGWWPLLELHEGYWFSPFVRKKVLEAKLKEFEKVPLLMWDAELPKRRLLLLNVFGFFKKRRMIREFFNKFDTKVYTAEYFVDRGQLSFLGLSFPKNKNKVIKMMYSSMHNRSWELMKNEAERHKQKFGKRLVIGLGCLAVGIQGNEPLVSPKNLVRDLAFCKKLGVDEVVVFRLEGLTKEYLSVLESVL